MKKRIIYLLFSFLIPGTHISLAQNPIVDSLLNVLKTAKEDTTKVNTFNELFLQYEYVDDDQSKEYLNKALELSRKIGDKKGEGVTYRYLGFFAEDKGNYQEALKNYSASLKIREGIKNKKGIATSYGDLGTVYSHQGNFPEALKNYFAALKIYEEIGFKKGIMDTYNNMGNVYSSQGDYPEALKNYFASLKIRESTPGSDKRNIANCYSNIANVYSYQGNYSAALKNHFSSLKIYEAIGSKSGIANSYSGIGIIYYALGNYSEALKDHMASLKIKEELGDKAGITGSYCNIGYAYTKQKKYREAEEYLLKARELSKEIGHKEWLKNTFQALSELDSAKSNFKGAYENHKMYILYRDSLDNEETRRKTIQSQMTYDFEKKEAVADAEHKKELENQNVLAEEKSRKQKIIIAFVGIGLLFVLVFAGFVFRSLRVTRKQKSVIEQQKLMVEEHQKDIIDSIKYARRIQRSLLPTEKYIDKNLNRLKKR